MPAAVASKLAIKKMTGIKKTILYDFVKLIRGLLRICHYTEKLESPVVVDENDKKRTVGPRIS